MLWGSLRGSLQFVQVRGGLPGFLCKGYRTVSGAPRYLIKMQPQEILWDHCSEVGHRSTSLPALCTLKAWQVVVTILRPPQNMISQGCPHQGKALGDQHKKTDDHQLQPCQTKIVCEPFDARRSANTRKNIGEDLRPILINNDHYQFLLLEITAMVHGFKPLISPGCLHQIGPCVVDQSLPEFRASQASTSSRQEVKVELPGMKPSPLPSEPRIYCQIGQRTGMTGLHDVCCLCNLQGMRARRLHGFIHFSLQGMMRQSASPRL